MEMTGSSMLWDEMVAGPWVRRRLVAKENTHNRKCFLGVVITAAVVPAVAFWMIIGWEVKGAYGWEAAMHGVIWSLISLFTMASGTLGAAIFWKKGYYRSVNFIVALAILLGGLFVVYWPVRFYLSVRTWGPWYLHQCAGRLGVHAMCGWL
jgi:hypothetical protein